MFYGQNFVNLVMSNVKPILLPALAVAGLVLLVQHKTAGLVTLAFTALCAVGLVYNTEGAKDAILSVFNTIIGSGTITGVVPHFLIL